MLGVIGGNGVAATNRLCQLIEVKKTRAGAFRDAHHPEMIVWQATQAPSRSMFLEGRGPDWRPDYVRVAMGLKSLGCDKLCMCCNTAHYAIDYLMQTTGLPFINVICEVGKACRKEHAKRVGLMVTDGSVKFGIYDKYLLRDFPEMTVVYPDSEYQAMVTRGICNAKSSARYGERGLDELPGRLFDKVVGHLLEKGCDTVVLGCTDIGPSYHPDGGKIGVKIVDSLEVLADAVIHESEVSK